MITHTHIYTYDMLFINHIHQCEHSWCDIRQLDEMKHIKIINLIYECHINDVYVCNIDIISKLYMSHNLTILYVEINGLAGIEICTQNLGVE